MGGREEGGREGGRKEEERETDFSFSPVVKTWSVL